MKEREKIILFCLILLIGNLIGALRANAGFSWPNGKSCALSLSFDDARLSQVDIGIPLLDQYGVKATFFVLPNNLEARIDDWKRAVSSGHEIGNHTVNHPCTGNFFSARKKAIEAYTLAKMHFELTEANQRIKEAIGVLPVAFAYPCGQKFVGRGLDTRSYVPLVAEMFIAGRGYPDEALNDPAFCDLAQLMGMKIDDVNFEEIASALKEAKNGGQWVIFVSHEVGKGGPQTTKTEVLTRILQYAQNPDNEIWVQPVGTVAKYIFAQRKGEVHWWAQPFESLKGETTTP
jgi:peptidoglycan-N-acetylglucosamine deacetylase